MIPTATLICAALAAVSGTGHWVITYSPDPSSTTSGVYKPLTGPSSIFPDDPDLGTWDLRDGDINLWPVWLQTGSSASLTASGTWNVIATWVDSAGQSGSAATNPPPPANLCLRVEANAGWAFGNGQGGDQNVGSGAAANGLNDPYQTQYGSGYNNVRIGGASSGKHVYNLPVTKGVVKLSIPQSASCSVSVPVTDPAQPVSLTHSLTASLDTRIARIARQGGRNETVDAYGNTSGDTVYSYFDKFTTPLSVVEVVNKINFIPQMIGSWTMYPDSSWPYPNVEVKWSGMDCSYDYTPKYTFDYSNSGIYLQRTAPMVGSGGSTGTLNLTLKDLGDGAIADNTYHLTYHLTGENWHELGFHEIDIPNSDETTGSAGVCKPGDSVTLSTVKTRTVTSTDEVSLDFGITVKASEMISLPVMGHYKKTVSSQLGSSTGLSITTKAPATAARAELFWYASEMYYDGTLDYYDAGGPLGTGKASYHDANDITATVYIVFYDANGTVIRNN